MIEASKERATPESSRNDRSTSIGGVSPGGRAQQWLDRQIVPDGSEPMLDEGDCRLCGAPAGEGHEPTDPCGIVADLLAENRALRVILEETPRHQQALRAIADAKPNAVQDVGSYAGGETYYAFAQRLQSMARAALSAGTPEETT